MRYIMAWLQKQGMKIRYFRGVGVAHPSKVFTLHHLLQGIFFRLQQGYTTRSKAKMAYNETGLQQGYNSSHQPSVVVGYNRATPAERVCEICWHFKEFGHCSCRLPEDAVSTVSCSDWIPVSNWIPVSLNGK